MMNYDDRSGKKPLDFNAIQENEQQEAAKANAGAQQYSNLKNMQQSNVNTYFKSVSRRLNA